MLQVEQLEARNLMSGLWVDPLPHRIEGTFYMRMLAAGWVSYPVNNLAAFGIPAIEDHAPDGINLPVAPKAMAKVTTHPGIDPYWHPESVAVQQLSVFDLTGDVRAGGSFLQSQADGLHAYFTDPQNVVIELLIPEAWKHPDTVEPIPAYTGF